MTSRIFRAMLACAIALAACGAAHAETAVTEVGKTLATQAIDAAKMPAGTAYGRIRNSPYVVLRAEPKLESAAVATLGADDKILVIGRQNDWVQVTTTKGTGWMRSWYLQEPAGGAAATPGATVPVPTATAVPPAQPGTILTTSPAVPASPATPTRISDPAPPKPSAPPAADPPKVTAPPATAKGGKALLGWLQAAGLTGETLRMAWSISMAESGGNPRAFNGNRNTGDQSYGLFQINMIDKLGPARRKQFGISSNEQLFDPMTNIKAMKIVSGGFKNWKPWSVYKHGTYKKFYGQFPPK